MKILEIPNQIGPIDLSRSIHLAGRLALIAVTATAIAACAAPKRAKRPLPASPPAVSESGPPPQVSACREYADTMAGRQMQRDFDSIQGGFQGESSQVFRDFARMDAQRYYRQLYESCLSQQRGGGGEATTR